VALYAAERWTQAAWQIEVNWKLLKCGSGEGWISWVDKKTNEEILNMVQEDRKIVNTIWYQSINQSIKL